MDEIITVAERDTAAAAQAAVGRPSAAAGRRGSAAPAKICLKMDSLAYDWLTRLLSPTQACASNFVGLSLSSSARSGYA